jgi:amino acid transporter
LQNPLLALLLVSWLVSCSGLIGRVVLTDVGLTVFCGVINSMPTGWMAKVTSTYVIFHVFILVACSIALLVMTKDKHSAKYVFTDTTSATGWTPASFSWLFGFLSVSWTMTGNGSR